MKKNKNLNLLVLTELFLPTKGGTAVWFDKVYRHLGGKSIHVVTNHVPGCEEYDKTHPNSIYREKLVRVPWMRPEAIPIYMKLFIRGLNICLHNRIDAIHAGRVLPEGLVGLWLSRLLKKPLVVYAHGEEITSWKAPRRRRALRNVYRSSDAVIANSEFTYNLLSNLGVEKERLNLILPGVDLGRFHIDGPTDDMPGVERLHRGWPLVVSVGRLSRRKGFDKSIESVSRLREKGMDLDYVIIGIGEQEDELKGLIKMYSLQDRVHMLGHVEETYLAGWLRRADIFLMPNREINGDTEGFGMVFIEAAASGTPAIAGRSGGTSSAVVDGKTGFIVDGNSVQEIAHTIERMVIDKALLNRISQEAYKRARDIFSWENVADKTYELNEKLTRKK